MALIVRTFRSRPSREEDLLDGLRRAAAGMVRYLRASTIVICRQTNDPHGVVWIGDRGRDSDFVRLPFWKTLAEPFQNNLAASSTPLSLSFLDEFYRSPSPPFQVWSLEVRAPRTGQMGALMDLFEVSRVARRDPRVVGISLYRAVEDPDAFVGFLALAWGFTPSRLLRDGAGRAGVAEAVELGGVSRPLSVVCEVAHLPAGDGVPARGPGASLAPFWVRSGVPLGSSMMTGKCGEVELPHTVEPA